MAPSTYCGMPQFDFATSTAADSDAAAKIDDGGARARRGSRRSCCRRPRDDACDASPASSRRRDPHHGAPVGIEAQAWRRPADPSCAAPAIAASVSSTEDMVSIHSRSAPPRASAAACSANAVARRLGAQRRRAAASISPVGPMLPPTSTVRPARSASRRAMCGRRLVELRDASAGVVQLQTVAGAAEGVRQDDVRAGLDEGALRAPRCARGWSVFHKLGRIAGLQAAIEQIAAGGAVGEQPRSRRRAEASVDRSWRVPCMAQPRSAGYAKGCWRTMVCSRSGPVEMMSIGTPSKRLQPLEVAPRVVRQLLVARRTDARSPSTRADPRTRPRSRRTARESSGGVIHDGHRRSCSPRTRGWCRARRARRAW